MITIERSTTLLRIQTVPKKEFHPGDQVRHINRQHLGRGTIIRQLNSEYWVVAFPLAMEPEYFALEKYLIKVD